jgi:hypothetical protein
VRQRAAPACASRAISQAQRHPTGSSWRGSGSLEAEPACRCDFPCLYSRRRPPEIGTVSARRPRPSIGQESIDPHHGDALPAIRERVKLHLHLPRGSNCSQSCPPISMSLSGRPQALVGFDDVCLAGERGRGSWTESTEAQVPREARMRRRREVAARWVSRSTSARTRRRRDPELSSLTGSSTPSNPTIESNVCARRCAERASRCLTMVESASKTIACPGSSPERLPHPSQQRLVPARDDVAR